MPALTEPEFTDLHRQHQLFKIYEVLTTLAVTIDPGDVQIGAVELKNAADDTRAKVGAVNGLAVGDNGVPVAALLIGAQLTPTITTHTGNGSTTAGKRVLTFILSDDFAGTIDGETFAGADDATLELRAPEGCTLASVAFTISAGNLRLVQI